MRALLVVLLIFTAFGAAMVWQSGTLSRLRAEHTERRGVLAGGPNDPASRPLPAGWGVVVLGDPSGVDPVELAERPGTARALPETVEPNRLLARPAAADVEAWRALETHGLADYEIEVRDGMTLSKIVRAHYGEVDPELCARLATYNGLDDANALKVGATLRLPHRDKLDGAPEPGASEPSPAKGRILR